MRTKHVSSFLFYLFLILIITITPGFSGLSSVFAKGAPDKDMPPPVVEVVNPYYTLEMITLEDGTAIEKATISGPPRPLPEYEVSRQASIQPLPSDGIIASFPSYDWVFGCSAVSGAMIAGYYDRNGYPNMYAGPTNGGVMPLTDTSWPTWSDGYESYPNNPLVASHLGVDGRAIKGSIDDYWVSYGSTASDPYIGNWAQHTWSDAIGDFMKTSQSSYSNTDGSTHFYNYTDISDPLTCSEMEYYEIDHLDGTYGRKLFYEARGYTVTDCYNQKTENNAGDFTLADFQAEINAGHPVLLNLFGHSIVGYGYSGSTIYIRDTWDNNPSNTYTMTWGGSYGGMVLLSVSIVRLNPMPVPPSAPTGVSASDGTFTDKVQISWNASSGAAYYKIYRNTSNTTSGAAELSGNSASSPYDDLTAVPGGMYYYWVKACNSAGCSGFSSSDSGFIIGLPPAPIVVAASDGTFSDKVRVTWGRQDSDYAIFLPLILNGDGEPAPIPEEVWYEVYRNTADSTGGALLLSNNHPGSPYDDTSAIPGTTYFYWVKACNSGGCSGFSASDSGYRSGEITVPSAPQDVDASDGTYADRVHLTWTASTGATYYKVFRNTDDNSSTAMTLSASHAASPYDDTLAVPEISYYYWVKACNPAGCSGFSSSDSGYRADELTVPLAPDQVDASNGNYSDKVHLTWAASAGATYYKIYRHTVDNPDTAIHLSESFPGSPYDDTSVVPGTTYYYWLKACNSAGCSGFSSSDTGWLAENNLVNGDFEEEHVGWTEYSSHGWDLIMPEVSTPIDAQSGDWLAWLGGGDNEISALSQDVLIPAGTPILNFWYWINSSDICNWDYAYLKVNEITLLTYDLCLDTNTGGWVLEDIDLTDYAGSTIDLKFEVTTDGSTVSNFFLDHVSLSAAASEPPLPPTGLSASDGIYTNRVRLSWNTSDGATSYQVFRNTINSPTDENLVSDSIVTNLFDDYSAPVDTTLYYWVKACNSIGCSDFSSVDTGYLGSSTLFNGNFELGDTGWTEYSTFAYDVIREFSPGSAHSGTWAAFLAADNTQNGKNGVMQIVTVPVDMPYLHFWYQIDSDDWCNYDYGYVRVDGSDEMTFNLCVDNNTSGWTETVVDLTVYVGQSVTLEFEGDTDSSYDSYFYIDTVSFSSNSTAASEIQVFQKQPLN